MKWGKTIWSIDIYPFIDTKTNTDRQLARMNTRKRIPMKADSWYYTHILYEAFKVVHFHDVFKSLWSIECIGSSTKYTLVVLSILASREGKFGKNEFDTRKWLFVYVIKVGSSLRLVLEIFWLYMFIPFLLHVHVLSIFINNA